MHDRIQPHSTVVVIGAGAYSHSSLDTLGNEAEILQRPIAGRILLAGEALSDRNGYVDGAWSDGQRAASVIINDL